jgi:Na+/H+-translocating membrane pyrophosphatase
VKRIRIVAVIAGLAADLIGTIIVSAAVTFAFVALRSSGGQRPEAILQTLATDPLFLIVGYVGGIAFTLLGAYIVARMSRPNSVLNTLVFGIISTLLIVFFASMYPLWYNILCVLTIIPVSLLPGYLLARQTV